MAEVVAGAPKTPGDFLKSIKGKPVVVKLNSGVDYRGERLRGCSSGRRHAGVGGGDVGSLASLPMQNDKGLTLCGSCTPAGVLACLDGYMNIAMEQTEVWGTRRPPAVQLSCGPARAACALPTLLAFHYGSADACCPAGIREWPAEEQVWGCIYSRQQR